MGDHESRDPGKGFEVENENTLFDRKLDMGFGDGVLYGVTLMLIVVAIVTMGIQESPRAAVLFAVSALMVFLLGVKLGAELKPKEDD